MRAGFQAGEAAVGRLPAIYPMETKRLGKF